MVEKSEGTITSNPYRLPRTVVPSAYRLRIDVDLDGATFAGSIAIDVEITQEVTTFALNAIDLDVSAATVRSDGQAMVSAAAVLDDQFEMAAFSFDAALPVGPATISLDFTGTLNDQLRGFYRSTFTDGDGATHVIATTQFASTDARRAFPCWDDLAFKATYQVTLPVPPGSPGMWP